MGIRIPEKELVQGSRTTRTPRQQITVPAVIEGRGLEILGRGIKQLGRGAVIAQRRADAQELREQREREAQAQKEQTQIDRIDALGGLEELHANWQDLDRDYYGLKGVQYIGKFEPYKKELNTIRDTIRSERRTSEAQAMYDTFASTRTITALNKALIRQRTEIDRGEKARYTTMFRITEETLVENNDDLFEVKVAFLSTIEGATPGASGIERKQIYGAAVSKKHKEVIGQLVVSNPAQARDWFKKYKKEILPSERPEIENRINQHEIRKASQFETDRITALITAKDGTLAEAKAENKKRNENRPEIRDEVDKRLKNNWVDAAAIEKEHKQKLKDNVITNAQNATSLNQALDAISVQGLTGTERNDLEKTIYAMWERRTKTKPKKPIITDRAEMVRIRQMIDDGEIETKNQLLVEVGDSADNAAWLRIEKFYDDFKKGTEIKEADVKRSFQAATGLSASADPAAYDRYYENSLSQAEATKTQTPTYSQHRDWAMEFALTEEGKIEFKVDYSETKFKGIFGRITAPDEEEDVEVLAQNFGRAIKFVNKQAEAEDIRKPTDPDLRRWLEKWYELGKEPGEMKGLGGGIIAGGWGKDVVWGKATDEERKTWLPLVAKEEEEGLNERIQREATSEIPPYSDFMRGLFKRTKVLGFDYTDELKAELLKERASK